MSPRAPGMRRCPECGFRSAGGFDHNLECSLSRARELHVFTDVTPHLVDGPEKPYIIAIDCAKCFDRRGRHRQLAVLERHTEFHSLTPKFHPAFRDQWFAGWRLIPTVPIRDAAGRRDIPAPAPGPGIHRQVPDLRCDQCGHSPRVKSETLFDQADTWRAEGRIVVFV